MVSRPSAAGAATKVIKGTNRPVPDGGGRRGGIWCPRRFKAAAWSGLNLGMEAIYEFDVVDMPVTVAVDSGGTSVHETGPKEWQAKIGKIPVVQG